MSKDSDNIQVIIRVRPLNKRELEEADDCKRCVIVDQQSQKRLRLDDTNTGPRDFEFDWVGDERTSQQQIFDSIGKSMVERCLKGYNCCIFAYGQTGAGKTYTMQGKDLKDCDMDDSERGLQPRVFSYMFDMMSRETKKAPGTIFTLFCSYLEIYNEQIMDLLNPKNTNLKLREAKEVPFVEGLEEIAVTSPTSTIELLRRGAYNRHVSSTRMNSESSRSHSIFTMTIECQTIFETLVTTRKSKFHFVDLAGSERQSQTNSMGERLKEAGNINKSLSVLGQVIKSIVDIAPGEKKYIRYRDSKLTYLLKDSLGGNSKTALIANISPSSYSVQETKSTLQFAYSAKQIKNKAQVNEGLTGNIEDLKNEIKKLKEAENSVNQLKLEHSEQIEKLMQEISCLRQREAEAVNRANSEIQRCGELEKKFEEIRKNDEQNFNNRLQEMHQRVLEMNQLRDKEMENARKALEENQRWSAWQVEENKKVNDFEISKMANELEALRANSARLEKIACELRWENSGLKTEANRIDSLYRTLCEKNQATERKLNDALRNNTSLKNENQRLRADHQEWRTANDKLTKDIKKLEASCADKDRNISKLDVNLTEMGESLRTLSKSNSELLTEKESYSAFASDLSTEESVEPPRAEESIVNRNQHFDNWQKKIDTVFRNVLRAENLEGDGVEFEEGEEVDFMDAINGLEELEEKFYDREEELRSVLKIPRQRENQQVRIIRVHDNPRGYQGVNPGFVEKIKRLNKQSRTKVNQLEGELEKEEQRKLNVKDILIRVFEHSKKVNKVYEQEIQELTTKLNQTMSEEKSKRDLHVRIKWFEKQLEEKNSQLKQYQDKMEEIQSKLESSADKEELERVEEKNSDLKEKVQKYKSKYRDCKSEIKELENQLGESQKQTKELEKQSTLIQIKVNQSNKSIAKLSKMLKSSREREEEFYKSMEQELALMSQNPPSQGQRSEDKENRSPSDDENRAGQRLNKHPSASASCGKRSIDEMLEVFPGVKEEKIDPQSGQSGGDFDFKTKKVKYN